MIIESTLLALIIFLIFLALLLFFIARVNRGHSVRLRHIPAFDSLKGLSSRAIEAGRPFHLSLGVGGVTNQTTADSLAGLYVLDYLAEQAAATGIQPVVSMADPAVLLFAQNRVRAPHREDDVGADNAARQVRWIAPQPAAYAAGVMNLLEIDEVEANIMVGQFGDEYLLMGEAAVRGDVAHIGGTSDPNTLPFIYATAQETLLGEEIYAAAAYLQQRTAHIGSLLAQDTMRWLVAGLILGGVLLTSLG